MCSSIYVASLLMAELQYTPACMDAVRISDGRLVFLKRVNTDGEELHIVTYFSQEPQRSDRGNHAVPVLDVFADDVTPRWSYVVMPLLRAIDHPPFEMVEDIVHFADQILEVCLSMVSFRPI